MVTSYLCLKCTAKLHKLHEKTEKVGAWNIEQGCNLVVLDAGKCSFLSAASSKIAIALLYWKMFY
jgi:hypothetical protein